MTSENTQSIFYLSLSCNEPTITNAQILIQSNYFYENGINEQLKAIVHFDESLTGTIKNCTFEHYHLYDNSLYPGMDCNLNFLIFFEKSRVFALDCNSKFLEPQ